MMEKNQSLIEFSETGGLKPAVIEERLRNARDKAEKLIEQGRRANSERAFQSDLAYFWRWAKVAFGLEESYPVAHELIYSFVSEHLSGLDVEVDKILCRQLVKATPLGQPHKLASVRRRLSSLSRQHQQCLPDLEPRYVYHSAVRELLSAAAKQPQNKPKQKDAITLDILEQLFTAIDTRSLRGVLLRAVLAVGFASGGRRRSELVAMQFKQLKKMPDAEFPHFYYLISLAETKTHQASELIAEVPVSGLAAVYLQEWLELSAINEGYLFRSISRRNSLGKSLSAEWIRLQIKETQKKAGLEHLDLSPHSLRAGFITQCGLDNVPAIEGMQMSLHRSESSFNRYYRAGKVINNRAARLMR